MTAVRPMTLVEKIIARASGERSVAPGQIVTCRVDLAMFHDSSGPRRVADRLKALGVGVWDPERLVVVSDHFAPASDLEGARILKLTRDWAAEHGVRHFYDMQGICHVMLAENGHLKPGMFVCGGDSHSPNGGAYGCYVAGFGATEMTGVVATGEIWTRVPETIRVRLDGALPHLVSAKDVMLTLCRDLGMANSFKVVEYHGGLVDALPMKERVVLTNMAAELGAETAVIAPDATTCADIRAAGGVLGDEHQGWAGDADAAFEAEHAYDAATLSPMVAAPHAPANADVVGAFRGQRVDQCYIGACVGAKITDLHMAAGILRGRKVATTTRLLVAPASLRTTAEAAADGTLAALTQAGASLLPTGCGACAGYGAGVLADGETCISTTNRNFRGRMGSDAAQVFLGSPYTVAAAAVAGEIIDPRELADG